ncbi:MAG: hypothetical protein R3F62_19795 [Planctomycetota bacterium]
MNENPYQAPDAELQVVGVLSGRVEDLRKLANAQRGVILAIALYLIAIVSQIVVPPQLVILPALAGLAAAILGLVCTIMLAIRVYSPIVGVVLGVLCLVPCLGLLILVGLSQRATGILKQNGIRVGLGGARMEDFAALEARG